MFGGSLGIRRSKLDLFLLLFVYLISFFKTLKRLFSGKGDGNLFIHNIYIYFIYCVI